MHSINGVKLTSREIDVISCIINSRKTKKIANLLFLSPRTVETHIQNIMSKFRCNSQDSIIDFVEKSPEFKFIKNHYLNLLIKTVFEHQLKRISNLVRKRQLSCYIDCNDQQDYQKDIFQSLIKHLKIAGIELSVNCSNDGNNTQNVKNLNYNYNLQLLSYESMKRIIIDESPKYKQNTMFLIMGNDASELPVNKILHSAVIDFSSKEQYFHNVFKILDKLLVDLDCSKFIAEFEQLRANIIDLKTDVNPELLFNIQDITEKSIDQNQNIPSQKISNKRILVILGVFVCLITSIVAALFREPDSEIIPEQSFVTSVDGAPKYPEAIYELDNFLSESKDFSANNATKEQIHKNYNLAKQVENILIQGNRKELQAYFNDPQILSNKFVNYLYNLHALANYYLSNEHDGEKARKILKYAQSWAERYVVDRSKVQFNFDKLNPEEISAELAIIQDLPEMYTRIIYSLGRTHIYQGDLKDAERYFALSKYLGEKLGLFEGYLSDISGLEIIKKDKVDIDIKNGTYQQAEEKLLDSVKLYKELKNSNREYIVDYKPGSMNPQKIIPKEHIYNQVECGRRIAELYSKLIMITNDINKKTEYIAEIKAQFLTTKTSTGILTLSRGLVGKKAASVYNNLGNILLQLYDKSTDSREFSNKIAKELNLTTSNELEIIEQIFKLAELQSRNTDFTKADSYDGLVNLYHKEIEQKKLPKAEESILLTKIAELEKKRNYINKKLNRKYD